MTIATKDQERKVLAQIKKMVAELGENSYLATAFDGAFELAEQNIEDDAAYSTKYYENQYYQLTNENKKVKEDFDRTTEILAAVQKAHLATTENFEATVEQASKYANKIDDLEAELHYQESIVMELKAKLYDYMIKTA